MKKMTVFTPIVILCLILSACTPEAPTAPAVPTAPASPITPAPSQKLSFTGEVSLDSDRGTSMSEWYIKFKVKNNSSEAVTFDKVDGGFGMRNKVFLHVPASYIEPKVLKPGEEAETDFSTDGYTDRIIGDVGNNPVVFVITIYYKANIIAGPYLAVLPKLDTLPKNGSSEAPILLEFTGAGN